MKTEDEGEKREGNIIIYQTEENVSASPEDRKKHDKISFDALCEDGLNISKIETKNIIRLGKKDENTSRTRTMKVVVENKNSKDKIMENVNRLAEAEPRLKNIAYLISIWK